MRNPKMNSMKKTDKGSCDNCDEAVESEYEPAIKQSSIGTVVSQATTNESESEPDSGHDSEPES